MSAEIRKGDWVTVVGQVFSTDHHPEEFVVTFRSHNADNNVPVRRDRVSIVTEMPDFVEQCNSLHRDESSRRKKITQCERPEGHSGAHMDHATDHNGANIIWHSEAEYGRLEQ